MSDKLSAAAALMGKRGGSANTPAQQTARAANARLGGRPRKHRYVQLSNDFHNTEISLRIADDGTVSQTQQRRAWRELCGQSDCLCGDDWGRRGQQVEPIRFDPTDDTYSRFRVIDEPW